MLHFHVLLLLKVENLAGRGVQNVLHLIRTQRMDKENLTSEKSEKEIGNWQSTRWKRRHFLQTVPLRVEQKMKGKWSPMKRMLITNNRGRSIASHWHRICRVHQSAWVIIYAAAYSLYSLSNWDLPLFCHFQIPFKKTIILLFPKKQCLYLIH